MQILWILVAVCTQTVAQTKIEMTHKRTAKRSALVRARVPEWMKNQINQIAQARNESESVIVREALTHYLSAVSTRHARGLRRVIQELEHRQ